MMVVFKEMAAQVCANSREAYPDGSELVRTVDLEDAVQNMGTGSSC